MRYIILLCGITLLGACSKERYAIGAEELTGLWSYNTIQPSFAGENLQYEFYSDGTFTLVNNRFTDAAEMSDTCGFKWVDYVRGTYELTANQLVLNGEYADATFQHAQPSCHGWVNYVQIYFYEYRDGQLLLGNSEESIGDRTLIRQ